MDRLIQILEQLPLKERSYTDQSGQQKVFVTTGFVLTDGINKFYAVPHLVSYELSCREWLDQQQQRRFENGVKIIKMA